MWENFNTFFHTGTVLSSVVTSILCPPPAVLSPPLNFLLSFSVTTINNPVIISTSLPQTLSFSLFWASQLEFACINQASPLSPVILLESAMAMFTRLSVILLPSGWTPRSAPWFLALVSYLYWKILKCFFTHSFIWWLIFYSFISFLICQVVYSVFIFFILHCFIALEKNNF